MVKIEKYVDSNSIHNNPFTQEVINRAWDIIAKNKPEDEYYKYIMDLSTLISEICDKFDDYNNAYLLISSYPRNWKIKEKMSHYNYIRYHTEMYVINAIAIFDRFLQLVNYLYDLKLRGLTLKMEKIEKSGKVDRNALDMLTRFNHSISKIRETQNDIKHKKALDISELGKISTFEFLLKHSGNLENKDVIKFWIRNYLKKERIKYMNSNTKMAKYINDTFEILYPIFQSNLSKFTW